MLDLSMLGILLSNADRHMGNWALASSFSTKILFDVAVTPFIFSLYVASSWFIFAVIAVLFNLLQIYALLFLISLLWVDFIALFL